MTTTPTPPPTPATPVGTIPAPTTVDYRIPPPPGYTPEALQENPPDGRGGPEPKEPPAPAPK